MKRFPKCLFAVILEILNSYFHHKKLEAVLSIIWLKYSSISYLFLNIDLFSIFVILLSALHGYDSIL